MTARPKVNWRVVAAVWAAFREYVDEKYDGIEGRLGYEVDAAMAEYADLDAYAPVEAEVDRLIRAAGRTPADLSAEKELIADAIGGEETTLVQVHVRAGVKEGFQAAANQADNRPGEHLTRALQERMDGGRATRLVRKLERLGADTERLLAEASPDADGNLGTVGRRTVSICRRLGDEFTRDDLEDAIRTEELESTRTIRTYTERVLDRLEYAEHPVNTDLFIPEEEAAARADELDLPDPEAPEHERKGYDALDADERLQAIRDAAISEAQERGGLGQLTVEDVREDVFHSGGPSDSGARGMMERAATADPFSYGTFHGTTALRCDLSKVDR
ncbi:hypothetical protein HUG10_02965 [Halorarum halophilum]|uniref:Uncharacterized protein n=1 Tax=Halorarum halophilum TaxID=2743090 RepID=A0A7D5KTR5_9EURY|nr:hypothetical protein [Halobaculum halophilum]QLG26560.1 hypothetical protein HUG10_02965 [Halobaculum halophilum]